MAVLLDSSVLVRMADSADPNAYVAAGAVVRLRTKSEELVLARQVLYEYWAVVTRPAHQNGLGLAVADARRDIEDFKQRYTVPLDPELLLDTWLGLVAGSRVVGKTSHDARLVALMVCLKIPTVLTFNTDHFSLFTEVHALHPKDV